MFLRYEVGFSELDGSFASGMSDFHLVYPGPMDNTNVSVMGLKK